MARHTRLWIVLGLLCGCPIAAQAPLHPPIQPAPPPKASEFNRDLLRHIEDDAAVRNERENRDEALAFDAAVSFARRVTEQSFRDSARRDLTFVHLLGKEAKDYRGEIVEIRGTLLRNLDVGPTPALRADGVPHLFEAYIRSDKDAGQGWCVFHTEKMPTLPIGERINKPVVCRGYFFKVYAYREQGLQFRLPLLICRGIEVTGTGSASEIAAAQAIMTLPVLLTAVAVIAMGVAALFLWYRHADRRTRRRFQAARHGFANPQHDRLDLLGCEADE